MRHEVRTGVVAGFDRLTRLARGQPAIVGFLRRFVMPAITGFAPTRRAMIELVTGLDHPIRVILSKISSGPFSEFAATQRYVRRWYLSREPARPLS